MDANRSPWWLNRNLEIALLFFLPILIYIESLSFPIMGLDDTAYYFDSSLQGGKIGGLRTLWNVTILSDYSPITQLTIWLDLFLFGDQSWWGARLHNLLWFGLGTLAIRGLLNRLNVRRGVVIAVCMLYALHPICTQAALWLAERKHLVSLALSLWSVERYVAARQAGAGGAFLKNYAAAVALCVAAILSKPHAVAIPVMVAAYELAIATDDWKKRLLPPVPFFVAAAAFTLWNLTQVRDDLGRAFLGGSRFAAVICDGPILARYLIHMFFPVNLAVYYYVPEHGAGWLEGWAIWAGLLAFAGVTVWLAQNRRLVAFGWLFGIAGLSPALNLVAQVAPMTDHYHQWALPGWLLMFCILIDERLERHFSSARPRLALWMTATAAIVLAALSWMRLPDFKSMRDLFASCVLKQSDSALNWALYAWALTGSTAPEDREQLGPASLRALECPDQRRILPEVRMKCIVRAAILLHKNNADERMKKLVEDQAALLEKDGPIVLARIARGWSYVRADMNHAAVEALAAEFTPELGVAAAKLRAECRSGATLPNELPSIVAFTEKKAAAELSLKWTMVSKLMALSLLAEARLGEKQPERAFDVAAVVVNLDPKGPEGRQVLARVYQALGLPDAATALTRP